MINDFCATLLTAQTPITFSHYITSFNSKCLSTCPLKALFPLKSMTSNWTNQLDKLSTGQSTLSPTYYIYVFRKYTCVPIYTHTLFIYYDQRKLIYSKHKEAKLMRKIHEAMLNAIETRTTIWKGNLGVDVEGNVAKVYLFKNLIAVHNYDTDTLSVNIDMFNKYPTYSTRAYLSALGAHVFQLKHVNYINVQGTYKRAEELTGLVEV